MVSPVPLVTDQSVSAQLCVEVSSCYPNKHIPIDGHNTACTRSSLTPAKTNFVCHKEGESGQLDKNGHIPSHSLFKTKFLMARRVGIWNTEGGQGRGRWKEGGEGVSGVKWCRSQETLAANSPLELKSIYGTLRKSRKQGRVSFVVENIMLQSLTIQTDQFLLNSLKDNVCD